MPGESDSQRKRTGLSVRRIVVLAGIAIPCTVVSLWYFSDDRSALRDTGSGDQYKEEEAEPEALTSLLAIAAETDDWKRNAALYEVLAQTDQVQVEELIAAAKALDETISHRYDVVRILYERFVSLSPEAAVNHLLTGKAKPSWIASAFGAWAEKDMRAAVARATGLGPRSKTIASRAILQVGVPGEERLHTARHLGMENVLNDLVLWEHRRLPGEPLSDTWSRATQMQYSPQRDAVIMETASAWAAVDPSSTWQAVQAEYSDLLPLPENKFVLDVKSEVLRKWATVDPNGFADWLQDGASFSGRSNAANGSSLSSKEYDQARWALISLAIDDPRSAWAAVQQMTTTVRTQVSERALRISVRDIPVALELFDSADQTQQHALTPILVEVLKRGRVEEVETWWTSLDTRMQGRLARPLRYAFHEAPRRAKHLVSKIHDPDVQHRAALVMVRWPDVSLRDSWRWVETLGRVSPEKSAFRPLFPEMYARNSAAAIRAVSRLPDPNLRDYLLSLVESQ